MAEDYFSYFLFVLFIKYTETLSVHFITPDDHTNSTMHSHLQIEKVSKYCSNREIVCRSNNTIVCGLKVVQQNRFYKDFENACYLFMSNMCDHPHEEYFIASTGTCEQFLSERRDNEEEDETTTIPPDYEMANNTNSSATIGENENNTTTQAPALRQGTFSTLYTTDQSFDYHNCPYSCPKIYDPVCVSVNKGHGKYFKMLQFINHCAADLYYCQKWETEFVPPPGEPEMVKLSPLGWSFCGAHRYLQFARFAEGASSMQHYGWLKGNYKFSHIMEPHERSPGYG